MVKKAERADALAYGIRDIFSVFILFYLGGTCRYSMYFGGGT